MRHDVEVNLRRENIPARVEARIKRPYSVFQKMKRQKIALDQVYDLLALRIITDSVKNCYAALGVIHNEWHPIPGRIKDFIAIPRPNLYQSLHTSVIGPGGRSFEVQIRTDEMHRLAEEGIAAHWKYKEGRKGPGADDQRIKWLRQLVEWQQEMHDPERVHIHAQSGSVPGGSLHLYAEGQSDRAAARGDADRLRLRHPQRRRQHLRGRQGERAHRPVEVQPEERRHGRDSDAGRSPAQQRLARAGRRLRGRATRSSTSSTPPNTLKRSRSGRSIWRGKRGGWASRSREITKADLERVAGEYGCGKIEDLYAALGYGKFSARQVLQKLAPDAVAGAGGGSAQASARASAGAGRSSGRSRVTWSSK